MDVGIVCFPTAPRVEEEDGLGDGDDLGVDEGMFYPNVVPFFDEERAGTESMGCECGERRSRWCPC